MNSSDILSEITIYSKYARYLPELKRRETWQEIIQRNVTMHIKKYPQLKNEIINNFQFVLDKKVLPSMRALKFAGRAIEVNPARIFNCSYAPIDHYYSFAEAMFLLLGG